MAVIGYAHNPDARLTKVTYDYGNRAPTAQIEASVVEGAEPLEVQFSGAKSSDPDKGDQLGYEWYFPGQAVSIEGV